MDACLPAYVRTALLCAPSLRYSKPYLTSVGPSVRPSVCSLLLFSISVSCQLDTRLPLDATSFDLFPIQGLFFNIEMMTFSSLLNVILSIVVVLGT